MLNAKADNCNIQKYTTAVREQLPREWKDIQFEIQQKKIPIVAPTSWRVPEGMKDENNLEKVSGLVVMTDDENRAPTQQSFCMDAGQ